MLIVGAFPELSSVPRKVSTVVLDAATMTEYLVRYVRWHQATDQVVWRADDHWLKSVANSQSIGSYFTHLREPPDRRGSSQLD